MFKVKLEPTVQEEPLLGAKAMTLDLQPRPQIGDAFAAAVKQERLDDAEGVQAPPAVSKSLQSAAASTSSSSKEWMETPVKVKSEPQVKKEYFKLEPVEKEQGTTNAEVKLEVKTERDTEVKTGVKTEIKTEIKTEVKTEIKSEIKTEIKDEIKTEIEDVVKTEPGIKVERVKLEPDEIMYEYKITDLPAAKRRRLAAKCPPNRVWELRLPEQRKGKYIATTSVAHGYVWHWANQCCSWQSQKKFKWSRSIPCCLANMFLEQRAPPLKGQTCVSRLTDDVRKKFWEFVNSQEANEFFHQLKAGHCERPVPPFHRYWWTWLLRPDLAEEDRVPFTATGRSKTFDYTSFMPMVPRDLWGMFDRKVDNLKDIKGVCPPLGTQIFEGVGKVKHRITGKTAPPESADSTARSSDEPPTSSQFISVINGTATSEDPTGRKSRIHVAARSAGVRNISWNETCRYWTVSHQVPGKGQKLTSFPTGKWVAEGLAFEEAVARALGEAKAFLAELRARGAIRDAGTAARSSGVRGVTWFKRDSAWRVRLDARDSAGRQIHVEKSQYFRPADGSEGAIEEARLKAVRCRQDMEARHQVFVQGGKPIAQRK